MAAGTVLKMNGAEKNWRAPYAIGPGTNVVKLALLIGAALGRYTVVGMLVGMLAAAAVAIVVLVREGRAGRKKAIPYGPFLALGAILALFLDAP